MAAPLLFLKSSRNRKSASGRQRSRVGGPLDLRIKSRGQRPGGSPSTRFLSGVRCAHKAGPPNVTARWNNSPAGRGKSRALSDRGCPLGGRNLLSRVTGVLTPAKISSTSRERIARAKNLLSLSLSVSLNHSAYHPVAAIAAISNECPALWADRAADSGPRTRAR